MRKFFTALVAIFLGLIFVVFAVANRHFVTVSFDPFNSSDPSIAVKLPLFVYGYGPENTPFYEQAYTIATNVRGGLICMQTPVQPGQRLLITNKENECSQECVVEFLGARLARGVDVGFEFSEPAPQFWAAGEIQAAPASADEQACA